MIIHLGGEVTVLLKDIVAILDIKRTGGTDSYERLLRHAEKNGAVTVIDASERQSCVVTAERIYLSPISPATLRRRAETPHDTDFFQSSR